MPSGGQLRYRYDIDTSYVHVSMRPREGSVEIDAAAGLVDDRDGQAEVARVAGGPADAEVGGDAADHDLGDAAGGEPAVEPGAGFAVGFEEGGVAVDRRVVAFAQDEAGMGDIEIGVQMSAPRVPMTQ